MTLDAGEILGVTGAPGAGMSTLIKAIIIFERLFTPLQNG